MLASSARRPVPGSSANWSRAHRAAAAGIIALVLLLSGCSEEREAAPDPSPTPIARLNTPAMQVPRIEFCTLVPGGAVAAALDGKPDSDSAYGNGDEEELPGVGTDVVHEIGCSWTGAGGSVARAWVFARPVDTNFAQTVIASGRRTQGCRSVPGPAYGKPAATQVCRFRDGEQRVRHAGLFGQTWLTCELTASGGELAGLRARTDRWCVEVANALNTSR